MHSRKGYSLIELLAVLVILVLVVLLTLRAVYGEIDRARGSKLIAEARAVHVAAQAVMIESKAFAAQAGDDDYMHGLTGMVDDASRPVRTMLSQRMRELLEPDIVLAAEAGENIAKVVFEIKYGVIVSMTYETVTDGRYYIVTIAGGEAAVTRADSP